METFVPYSQILIFEEQLSLSNMDFYIDTDQAQIDSAGLFRKMRISKKITTYGA